MEGKTEPGGNVDPVKSPVKPADTHVALATIKHARIHELWSVVRRVWDNTELHSGHRGIKEHFIPHLAAGA
jgi:hypothetical protein